MYLRCAIISSIQFIKGQLNKKDCQPTEGAIMACSIMMRINAY